MKISIETIVPVAPGKDKNVILKIDYKGTLDNNNTTEFDFIMNTLINGGARKVIMDINELQYLDSTGIGSIISVTKKLRKEGGDLVITRYTQQILTIIRPINMEKLIRFFPTVEEGLNYLRANEVTIPS